MRKLFFIFLIHLSSIPIICIGNGTIDSLRKKLLLINEDSIRVDILNEISWQYRNIDCSLSKEYAIQGIKLSESIGYRKGQVDAQNRLGIAFKNCNEYEEALKVYKTVLATEIKAKDTFGIARVNYQIANVYEKIGEYDHALKYLEKSLSGFTKLNDLKNIAKTQNLIGGILLLQSQYEKALSYFLKALEVRITLHDSVGIANSQLNIGLLYQKIGDYKKSQEYFSFCVRYFEKIDYQKGMAKCYNNIGNNFFYLGKYNDADHYYQKSLRLKATLNDQNAIAYTYLNLGKISENLDKPDKALNYYEEALLQFEKYKNKRGLATANMNIGLIHNQNSNQQSALKYLFNALKLSDDIGDLFLKIEILKLISSSYSHQRNFEEAIHYSKIYDKLKDSLNLIYKNTVNYRIRYEEEKQKMIIAEKENQIEVSKHKRTQLVNYILRFGILILLAFIFILIIFFRQKQKRTIAEKNLNINQHKINELLKNTELKSTYAKLEGQDEERKRIARDLHDRLGSTLSTIKLYFSAVENKLNKLADENKEQYNKANHLLDKASDEVHKIAKDMNSGLLTKFGLIAELRDLATTIEETSSLRVKIIESGYTNRLDITTEGKIYRIIQELVSNVLKHAKANNINIQITRFNGTLNIIVEDDGIGFDHKIALKKNRLGLKNVESRVLDLNGELIIDSGKGAGTTISIDLNLEINK